MVAETGERYWGEYQPMPGAKKYARWWALSDCFTADLVLLFVGPLYRVKWNGVGRWQQGTMEFYGRFLRGKFDLGVRTSADMVCRGQWDDDLLHGHAVMTVPRTHDGVVVVTVSAGQFVRRHFDGLGVYRERDGGVDVVVDAGEFKVTSGLSLT